MGCDSHQKFASGPLLEPKRFLFTRSYSILVLGMTKRKPVRFSATKAVKANARERIGQPKPGRVIPEKPRTGRQTKHKQKMEEIIRQEE